MKRSSRLGALALVGFCLLALGTTTADEQPSEPAFIPLLETHGSPWMMDWGAHDYPRYDSASDISIHDQDGDGVHELLVAGSYIHSFSLDSVTGGARQGYVNIGREYGFGSNGLMYPWVRALDLNGDGKQDLVTLDSYGTLRCFMGELNYYVLAQEEEELLLEWSKKWLFEATGDGVTDLVASSKDGGTWIYPGLGDGRFSVQPISVEIDVSALYITDGELSGEAGIWLSNSEGLWFRNSSGGDLDHISDSPAWRLATGDINGDGVPELVYWAEDHLHVADTMAGFVIRQSIEAKYNPAQIATGDFDGNGCDDVVVLLPPREFSYALYLSREGTLSDTAWHRSVSRLDSIDHGAYEMTIGDFDGDGIDDLAVALDYSVGFAVSSAGFRLVQPFGGSLLLGQTDEGLLVDSARGGIAHLRHLGSGRFEHEVLVQSNPSNAVLYRALITDVQGDESGELIALSFTGFGGEVAVWAREENGWMLEWTNEIHGTVRPILLAADLLGDNKKEIVIGVDDEIAILSPPSEGASGDTRKIDWGGPVGPLVVVPGTQDDSVVGFMVSEDEVLLKRISGTRVSTLDYMLEGAAPLDLTTVDANSDEYLDLAVAALGVLDEETDEPTLGMKAGFLLGEQSGHYEGEIAFIELWPPNAMIFPYGGMVAEDLTGNGLADIVLMRRGGDISTEASLYYLISQEAESQLVRASYEDIGQRLLALDINDDGVPDIVYSGQGTPTALHIAVWQRRWEK